jgi:VCBS repeat-containing protein
MVMMNRGDLDFILKQILIAEADSRGEDLSTFIPDTTLPWGLRRVDGSNNNLRPAQENFGAADQPFPSLLPQQFRNEGDDSMLFGPPGTPAIPGQTLLTNNNYGVNASNNPNITRGIQPGDVVDVDPRIISNLVVDQSLQNPAAIYRALVLAGSADRMTDLAEINGAVDALEVAKAGTDAAAIAGAEAALRTELSAKGINVFDTLGDLTRATVDLPNVAPDEGLSPPFNSWMTLFGQFFDHGLDLLDKGGKGTVYIPLQPDDELYVPGSPTNFMALTRASVDADGKAINKTTPWVDQNQTYTSNAAAQVFHREYELVNGKPQATGHLLEGAGSGLATWADVKAQALNLLGIELNDMNVHAIPEVLVDAYGNFIPGANGFVQLVRSIDANGVVSAVEGNPDGSVRTADGFVSTGHAFLDDIARNANPSAGKTADTDTAISAATDPQPARTYDNELLDRHFITGDGRGNENYGLTSLHYIFHSEHNRQVDLVKGLVLAEAIADPIANLTFLNEWLNTPITAIPAGGLTEASLDWNGERLFQAAKLPTEMQYQHLVFEEFGRTVQPMINVFNGYNAELDGAIASEFADVVYRFGHSMMGESVDRFDQNFEVIGSNGVRGLDQEQVSLFEAFMNPVEWTKLEGADGGMTQAEAAAAVARGMTRQVGQEIDEFVVGDLRNRLVGVPLDLAALNIARGRERGVPSLNNAREEFFRGSNDSAIKPYANWCDFSLNLRNPASIVNVIAAYGTHSSITSATTSDAKRDAAWDLVMGKPGDAAFNADRLNFLNARGDYAGDTNLGGLNEVDFWVGGLLEKTMPFGGMLGTTFNFVFEVQMEKLQDTDRFYYLTRLANLNLTAQLENNKFAEMIHRNTPAEHLPGNVFKAMDYQLEVDQSRQFNQDLGSADPQGAVNGLDPFLAAMTGDQKVIRGDLDGDLVNDLLQFVGGEHVVLGGTDGADTLIGGDGDDTLWGDAGDDNLEGGIGNDFIFGGEGSDVITDVFGDDEIRSNGGDDVVNGGPGLNLIIADLGSDVVIGGPDDEEFLLGQGNDFADGGAGVEAIFGGEGNDWLESGLENGLLLGDNGDLIQGIPTKRSVNSPVIGHDVTYNTGGNIDHDAETGNDVMVGGLGTDKFFGQLGFDWATHMNDPYGIYADMDDQALIVPLAAGSPGASMDRYQLTEAVSGSAYNDYIRGTGITPIQFNIDNILLDADVNLINGLNELLAGVDEAGAIRFSTGEILIGGGGSDLIEGRAGDDLIEGDSVLEVGIQVTQTEGSPYLVSRLAAIQQQLFSREILPSQLSIWRGIKNSSSAADVDVVQFSGNLADYTIEGYNAAIGVAADLDADGWVSITDNRVNRTDGVDRVKAVERALFSDGSIKIAQHANRMAEGRVSLSVDGSPAVDGTVTGAVGQVLVASSEVLRDWEERSAANPLSAVTAPVEYTWQVETLPGSGVFRDIQTTFNVTVAPLRGPSMTVTAAEAGLAIRVMGRFTDAAGAIETVFSNVSSVNPNDAPSVEAPITVAAAITELDRLDPQTNNFTHTATGSFGVVDPDFADILSVSVVSSTSNFPGRTTPIGTLVPTITDNTNGDGTGSVSWTYQVTDTGLNPLDAGVTATETFVLRLSDGAGGITNQVVTLVLTGTADPVNGVPSATGLVVSDSTPTQTQQVTVQGQDTISDPNGVPTSPVFTYQWQQRLATSTDPNAWTDITGATGVNFTPGNGQVNNALRVAVSFTDSDGFANSLFTTATDGAGDRITGTVFANTLTGTAYADNLSGGLGADTVNGNAGNDVINWTALNPGLFGVTLTDGRDVVDGGLGTLDTFVVNGNNRDETYRVYARASYLAVAGNNANQLNAGTEIVITRNGTNNASVIAELRGIEEITINTGAGNDTVLAIGDFNPTSLAFNTITIQGSEDDNTVDISALESAHRIHFLTNGGSDFVVGQLRPQDVIDIPAGANPDDYTATDNGDGTVTFFSPTHSVTVTTGMDQLPQLAPAVVSELPVANPGTGPADEEVDGNTTPGDQAASINEDSDNGDTNEDVSPEPTGPALQLGLSIVKNLVFAGDSETDVVLRRFGTEAEQGSKFYLALTAASLRDASINTLDVSVNLGETFGEVFELHPADIHFNDAMAVQRRVQVLNGENGPTIRFEGAGLGALASGAAIADTTVLAYIELVARGDIDDLIKDARVEDQYGFMNAETFSVPMLFTVDANVDQVVFSDLESLRDLGGADVLLNPELEVTARAAEAVLTTSSSFDLGTYREVVPFGEGSYTNLVRSGDTIFQSSSWRNDGEVSFSEMRLESISDAVAEVSSSFDSTGTDKLSSLGWSDQPGQGGVMEVITSFHIIGEAGSVVDTSAVGSALSAYGSYGWNTTQMEQFQVKHLVTYQGDLNYDGAVTMKDLAFLNAGAAMGTNPHDVDADFNGSIDMLDLSVIDADWSKSLHSGDGKFLGSDSITMDELFRQNGRRWDSSAFEDQNAIEAGEAGAPAYVNVLMEESNGLISAAGLDSAVVRQWEEQQSQQLALTTM